MLMVIMVDINGDDDGVNSWCNGYVNGDNGYVNGYARLI